MRRGAPFRSRGYVGVGPMLGSYSFTETWSRKFSRRIAGAAIQTKPEPFDCTVGYRQFPKGALPSRTPRNMTYLAQVEWAWSPAHSRLDAYYLHKGRTHWSLWSRYWDDNWGQWSDTAVGCVHRRGVSEYQAAIYLLLEFWRDDAMDNGLDQFHWVNEVDYLTVADLAAMTREIW
jgi:hypothetical protein